MTAYNQLDPISTILKRLRDNLESDEPDYTEAVDDAIEILRITHHLRETRGMEEERKRNNKSAL